MGWKENIIESGDSALKYANKNNITLLSYLIEYRNYQIPFLAAAAANDLNSRLLHFATGGRNRSHLSQRQFW